MEKKTGNHTADIHVVNYRQQYEQYSVGAEKLVSIDGRDLESLDSK